MKWKRWMRTKIVYHKHSIRNVYLFIYFTCFHSLIFYISLNQTNVVFFFRRISFSFISHRHFTSSFHFVIISSCCHFISLSSCIIFAKWTHQISCSSMYQTKRQQTQEFQSRLYKSKQHSSRQHQSKKSQSKKSQSKTTKEYQSKKRVIKSSSKSEKSLRKESFYQQKMKKLQTFDDFLLTWTRQSDRRNSTLSNFNWAFNIKNFVHSLNTKINVEKQKFSMTSINYEEFTKRDRNMNDFLLSKLRYFSRFFLANVC